MRRPLIDTVAKGARMLDNHPLTEINPRTEDVCGECNRVKNRFAPHACDTSPQNLNTNIRKAVLA